MSCVGCTIPASTLSVIWPNSSPSPAQPSIVPLPGRLNEAKAGMRHIALKIQRHLSLKITPTPEQKKKLLKAKIAVALHDVVRPNQRLAVDTFLGLKKSKLFFRTRVALHFQ